jgi:chromosome segregation ATPase
MTEYEAMKAEIARLQDELKEEKDHISDLTHDLSIARETITDVARVRDDFFESLSARDADVVTLEHERDEWKDKFETADQVVKDYRAAFGLKDGQSGYDMLEIHKYALGQLKDTQVDAREMAKALSHWIMFPSETNTEGLFDAFHQHGTQYIA